jgi:tropomyosin-1
VLENKSNMEDDRVAILEAQLAQAKLIAEEADKKYEEVSSSVVVVFALWWRLRGVMGCIPP